MGSKITLQKPEEEEKEEKEEEWSARARIHTRFRHTNRFQKEIFEIIMSYLRLGDIHMISMTSDQFWQDISDFTKRIFILDKSHVDVSSHSDLYWSMYACESIHTIDFSHNSLINQSTILSLLEGHYLKLKTVILDGCSRVSDREVQTLISSAMSLKRISVIQCTTGLSTIIKAWQKNIVLNRIPSWFVGSWHCVRHDSMKGEIHTYYPDGTFKFSRTDQSSGFVPSFRAVMFNSEKVLDIKITYYLLHPWMYTLNNTYPTVRIVKLDQTDLSNMSTEVLTKTEEGKLMMMSAQVNYGRQPSQDVMLPLNPRMVVPGANYSIGFWKREKLPENATSMMNSDLVERILNPPIM